MVFTTCQMCGKQYIRIPGSIYKMRFAGKRYNFCTYECFRHAEKCKEQIMATSHESDYIKFQDELKAAKEELECTDT